MASSTLNSCVKKSANSVRTSPFPPGISAIINRCARLYPDQPNPPQASPLVKCWLGGADPLDYISMYLNSGDEKHEIPEHWHYITMGLSDLYGDGRIHPAEDDDNDTWALDEKRVSGFGFELTFRLKRSPGELKAPSWPTSFLQDLARYVFTTENRFVSGDHVSWHGPLDNGQSKIRHVLMVEDPQLRPASSSLGNVEFLQVVGVCQEELEAAQHWNGRGVLELLRSCRIAGGSLWITNMLRQRTIFETEPQLARSVQNGINQDGSDLSGVCCACHWIETKRPMHSRSSRSLSLADVKQIRTALQTGLDRRNSDSPERCQQINYPNSIHLSFNREAGALLGLALRGRLQHGRHFTFRNVQGDRAITLVSAGVRDAAVSPGRPFATAGDWLQIYLKEEDILEICEDIHVLMTPEKVIPYRIFSWSNLNINITVTEDDALFAT